MKSLQALERPADLAPIYFNCWQSTVNLLLKSQKNRFQRLKQKYVAYQYSRGFRPKELTVESTFTFIADNFSAFFTGTRYCDLWRQEASCYLLIVEIGTLLRIRLTCSGRPIPGVGSIAASLFPLSADWLFGFAAGTPLTLSLTAFFCVSSHGSRSYKTSLQRLH